MCTAFYQWQTCNHLSRANGHWHLYCPAKQLLLNVAVHCREVVQHGTLLFMSSGCRICWVVSSA